MLLFIIGAGFVRTSEQDYSLQTHAFLFLTKNISTLGLSGLANSLMKKLLLTVGLVLPTLFFAQQTENPKQTVKECDLPSNYQEPKPDKKIQSWLKRADATIEDLRKHIAVENGCNEKDIIFLRISEQKGNGMYSVCVAGKPMKYKRMGSVFMGASENPFDTAK